MRIKKTLEVRRLNDKVLAIDENLKYVSMTTTYDGVKGRFLGYCKDKFRVGVFVKANTNYCKIVVKGRFSQEDKKVIVEVINLLKSEGFPDN